MEGVEWRDYLGIGDAHVSNVGIKSGVDDQLNGSDDPVSLGAVLDHQRIGHVGVEHDRVGRHQQDAGHHPLAVGDVPYVDLEEFLVSTAILQCWPIIDS